MYEQHFGLKKRPFRAKATGTDVFVGPQTATTMAGLKKALVASDAVASVSGPVGSGKTTLVLKALDSMAGQNKVIRIGRMRLQSSDVLAMLLDELGIENQPCGTIQKFNAFRRRLKELEDCNTRLVIAVEDSPRLGIDNLAEIEALTAADAGASEGANVVLMGDEGLDDLLRDPQLNRLQQRTRQRLQTTALCAAELRGYLRHCFRLAGGDFEQIFDVNAAALLHHLTDGIPRVANTVLESAMSTAAEQGLDRVSSELISRVGENEFGLSAAGFEFAPPAEAVPPAPAADPVVEAAAVLPAEALPEAEPERVLEPEPEPEPAPPPVPVLESEPEPEPAPPPVPELKPAADEPVIVFADVPEPADLPELIQDTLPDLQVLAPDLAEAPVLEIETPEPVASAPQPEPETPALEIPETPSLETHEQEIVAKPGDDVPAWDRDPTMAELRPDIAALEQAMAFTQSEDPEPAPAKSQESNPSTEIPLDAIPEITLDHAISQRIESQLIDEPGEISPVRDNEPPHDETRPELPALDLPAKRPEKSDTEIEKIAAELSRAKSLEDVDDRMAETLFGDELSLVASQFMKKAVTVESANDDIEEIVDVAKSEPQVASASSTVATSVPVSSPPANTLDVEVTMEAGKRPNEGGMDLSASQRLKTVRALNADLHPSLREPETPAANDSPPVASRAPESIEDQINTSMTQTLKALNVRAPVSGFDDDEDEDDEKGKSGFFSRFKRS